MMMTAQIYIGHVVHKRLHPRQHALRYRVFSLLVDVDELGTLARSVRWFSYNGRNLASIDDRDHGFGDGKPICAFARDLLAAHSIDLGGGKILLLTYPRVFGYVFNPISVFYCYDRTSALAAVIYEVNNTFGGRTHYVVRAGAKQGGVHAHGCAKDLFVSPFAPLDGRYSFRLTDPGEDLALAVMFRDRAGPLIKTHFRATAEPLTSRSLLSALTRIPFLTLKVIGAIHYEALKLWLKGVPLIRRPRPDVSAISETRTL